MSGVHGPRSLASSENQSQSVKHEWYSGGRDSDCQGCHMKLRERKKYPGFALRPSLSHQYLPQAEHGEPANSEI